MSWDLFISYASEDRNAFAKPLATALTGCGLRVWFDELELKPGDSIRSSIDRGLAQSKLGVVLLSKCYFEKDWTQLELGGLFATRSARGCRIVPVWLDVDSKYIAARSPMLADMKAIHGSAGVARAAKELESLVRNPSHGLPPPLAGVADYIRVQADSTVHGIDETYVKYARLLLHEGKNPGLLVDIHRDALGRAVLVPIPVYKAINGTSDFHKTLQHFNTSGAHGGERTLYLAMREIDAQIEELGREIRQGILELLTRDAVIRWIPSEQDVVLSMRSYIRLFFVDSHSIGPYHVELQMMKVEPRWKLHMYLNYEDATLLYRRTDGFLTGDWLDWSHDMLVGRLVPGILFRAIHGRVWSDPKRIPDSVFDLANWAWFVSSADPEWRRLTRR